MSNYTKATNFSVKDSLSSGDPAKLVKGTEIDTEFTAIASAISSKADSNNPTFTGTAAFTGTTTAPTATAGTSNTEVATTAFVTTALRSLYPVGSIYINATNNTNPGTLLGFGTWVSFGAGRVPVGFNSSDTSFDTAEKTGGSKNAIVVSHTHTFSATTASNGNHTHNTVNANQNQGGISPGDFINRNRDNGGLAGDYLLQGDSSLTPDRGLTTTAGAHTHTLSGTTASTGSSGTNANLQPYITVYMWKRTA